MRAKGSATRRRCTAEAGRACVRAARASGQRGEGRGERGRVSCRGVRSRAPRTVRRVHGRGE
eukprot:117094-Prymnesium_polylepis.2